MFNELVQRKVGIRTDDSQMKVIKQVKGDTCVPEISAHARYGRAHLLFPDLRN